ncbi:unnamed protein product, partial [Tenebrio molitor]
GSHSTIAHWCAQLHTTNTTDTFSPFCHPRGFEHG